jgi:soluble lytic murein transglycosylase-like protein
MRPNNTNDDENPRPPRRKSGNTSGGPGPADESKPPRRRRASEPDGVERPKPSRRRSAADLSQTAVAPDTTPTSGTKRRSPTDAEVKISPVGRILGATKLGQQIRRFAPVLLLLIVLLVLLGPSLIRVLWPAGKAPAVAPLFTPEVQHWAPQIVRWSEEYGVNANLIATLMQIESCGYPGAASQAGAQGLFQVIPQNFEPSDRDKMTDPETNARTGIGVIRDCLRNADGDVGLAMACYNGGPGLISTPPGDWPAETQRYYTWAGGIYNDAIRNDSRSDTLDNWLAAGGADLCARAAESLGLPTAQPRYSPAAPIANPMAVPTSPPALPTFAAVSPAQEPTSAGLPTFALPTNMSVVTTPPYPTPIS